MGVWFPVEVVSSVGVLFGSDCWCLIVVWFLGFACGLMVVPFMVVY